MFQTATVGPVLRNRNITLFTIDSKDLEKVENHPDFSVIGHMTKESDVNLITKGGKTTPISSLGWKSF